MSKDVQTIVANAKNLGKLLHAVLEVTDYLEETASIEQERRNALTARDVALASKAEAVAKDKENQAALDGAWAAVEDSKRKVDGLVVVAREEADEIKAKAKEHADVAMAAADKDVAALKAGASNVRATSDAQWNGHLDRMKKADAEFVELAERVENIKKELTSLRERIG